MLPNPPVMLITDAAQAFLPLIDIIEQTLRGGCRWILLRDLNASDDALLAQAQRVKKMCVSHGAKLFISRNFNIAKAVEADGVHLSASQSIHEARALCGDMPIGQSCHNAQEIKSAENNGADYITLSPVFATPSKPDYPEMGILKFGDLCTTTRLPVLALGGIDHSNLKSCFIGGAIGIAVSGHIMRSREPQYEMFKIIQQMG